LKTVYQLQRKEQAQANLDTFAKKGDGWYPTISKSWRANWQRITPFSYPKEIRRIIYTANAINP